MEKPLYTASVSKIEAFRKLIEESSDDNASWNNEENLILTLKGLRESGDKAKYGHAFHAIIEHPTAYRIEPEQDDFTTIASGADVLPLDLPDTYLVEGIKFSADQAKPAIEYSLAHPLMQKEIPAYKIYSTKHFDLMVTMRVDGLEGVTVRDAKTKYSTVNMQEYIRSSQWKFYIDCLDLDIFFYDVFQVSRFDTLADAHKAVIKPLEPMQLVRYPNMSMDIQMLLEGFADYIVRKGFQDLVQVIPNSHVDIELKRLLTETNGN